MDPRFDARNDPRFKRLSTRKRKVALDERFKCIVDDPGFTSTVDPRTGRKTKTKTVNQELRNLYLTESFDKPSDSVDAPQKQTNSSETEISEAESSDVSSHFSWNEESSDTSESSEDETVLGKDAKETADSVWDSTDANVPMGTETSSRLALLGCDWDCVTSQDLYVLLSSFASNVGSIKRVAIYLSDFGQERVDYERQHGPCLSLPKKKSSDKDVFNEAGEDVPEDEDVVSEAVRKYQKERSQYYFAVIECDSVDTAVYLYDELEGVDCDFSVSGLDFRYIPETEPSFTKTFPRPPRCEATECSTRGYEPPAAFISALRHSKVRCTWDETPVTRTRRLRKKFSAKELAALELEEYLASSCSETQLFSDNNDEENDEVDNTFAAAVSIDAIELPAALREKSKQKEQKDSVIDDLDLYRKQLLGSSAVSEAHSTKEKSQVFSEDIEIFVPASDPVSLSQPAESDSNEDNAETADRSLESKLTPWEKYLEKRKQRRRLRKEQLAKQREVKNGVLEQEETRNSRSQKRSSAFPLIRTGPDQTDLFFEKGDRAQAAEPEDDSVSHACFQSPSLSASSDDNTHVASETRKHRRKQKRKQKLLGSDRISNVEKTAQIDFDGDERFKELFTNPHLAADTTNPKFKMSDAYRKLLGSKIAEKRKKQRV